MSLLSLPLTFGLRSALTLLALRKAAQTRLLWKASRGFVRLIICLEEAIIVLIPVLGGELVIVVWVVMFFLFHL